MNMVIFPGQSTWVYVRPGISLWRVVELETAIWRWRAITQLKERLDEDAT